VIGQRAASGVKVERDAGAYYDAIKATGVDPLFVLAMFNHESEMGKKGAATTSHSWGNTRPPSFGVPDIGTQPQYVDGKLNGFFSVYRDWLDGAKSTAARLVEHVYKNRTAIREVFDYPPAPKLVWAPAGDFNNPSSYLRAVIDFMNLYADTEGTPPMAAPRIALSAGHHNTSGGNALEYKQVGELTEAIAAACKQRGMDVRVITPDGADADSDPGDGDFPGNLSAAAARVVEWSNAGWKADVFLEVHTEGAGPSARGAFAIYPDWGTDTDIDVKTNLGPRIVNALKASTGMPLRGNGTMSEKATGVGAQGFRLGIFGATASVRDFCTRLIVEFGSHDNAADLAIFNAPDFNAKAGAAVAESFAAFLNFNGGSVEPQPPVEDPNAYHDPATGFWVVNDHGQQMLTWYRANGGWEVLGRPMEPMHQDADGIYRQLFENVLVESWPNGWGQHPGPWVRIGGLGQRYQQALERIEELEAA
jgi:hypothetical protein